MQSAGSPAACYRARCSASDEPIYSGRRCLWRPEKQPQVQAFSNAGKDEYFSGAVSAVFGLQPEKILVQAATRPVEKPPFPTEKRIDFFDILEYAKNQASSFGEAQLCYTLFSRLRRSF